MCIHHDGHMIKKNPYILDTVSNSLKVLEYVANNENSTLTQISEALNINKTVVFRILYTLQQGGFVAKNSNLGYNLGPKVIQLSNLALRHNAIHQLVKGVLSRLTNDFNESSHMGLLNDSNEVLIVSKIDATSTIQMTSHIGKIMPAYCTAMGKCLLAYLDQNQIDDYLNKAPFTRQTNRTITSAQGLAEELKLIKSRGFSIDNEESEEGLYCISTPVYDRFDEVYAAISVSGPATRMKNKKNDIITQLKLASQEITNLEANSINLK
jgi:IclR family KDG regulon transcriptional repressor